jgi:hypothetical protein
MPIATVVAQVSTTIPAAMPAPNTITSPRAATKGLRVGLITMICLIGGRKNAERLTQDPLGEPFVAASVVRGRERPN